ncbi:polyhydroxyalkanoate synthesis repressor PhaR [Pseudomonas monteilii]|uniref:polyhydroxyalkanoate synthesis repressor PhaR n=1 Tax=Pseudomonas TaxID=286 RepID=UPI0015E37064|nr:MULTISPECIES: polyhydroxyalkanoate synthesis repressor PhaR [Pseudomonas]ELS0924931.1 polyhydroxyalkanoate synthesis repressor PhaR [Pseudomonas putida]MBA1316167.1 polyhydroxyalkanoate synthesis repressor PhaR [Pseudomonas monteilii]QUN67048.1 polyhydroxyalkanoate synthesis repressor PhaR [Pseudomonas sp. JS425]
MSNQNRPRLIKKYPNRRLYDTHSSCHVTLADLRQMVIDEIPFLIVDAKSGEDLTRSILMQIIQEAESGGEPIFSSDMLKSIIRFYGPLQGMFGGYLETSIQAIIDIQTQTGAQSSQAWSEFMHKQMPVMQDMMQKYIDQSKSLYLNTQNLFGLFGNMSAGRKADNSESDNNNDDKE